MVLPVEKKLQNTKVLTRRKWTRALTRIRHGKRRYFVVHSCTVESYYHNPTSHQLLSIQLLHNLLSTLKIKQNLTCLQLFKDIMSFGCRIYIIGGLIRRLMSSLKQEKLVISDDGRLDCDIDVAYDNLDAFKKAARKHGITVEADEESYFVINGAQAKIECMNVRYSIDANPFAHDYTINSVCYDIEAGIIIDLYNGLDHIENQKLSIPVPFTQFDKWAEGDLLKSKYRKLLRFWKFSGAYHASPELERAIVDKTLWYVSSDPKCFLDSYRSFMVSCGDEASKIEDVLVEKLGAISTDLNTVRMLM